MKTVIRKNIIFDIAWFNEKDWEEWKKISEDKIEDTYDEWLIIVMYILYKISNEKTVVS